MFKSVEQKWMLTTMGYWNQSSVDTEAGDKQNKGNCGKKSGRLVQLVT